VHAINFSGHSGEPFAQTFGIEAFADNVKSFLHEHSIHKVDIFGYSMGGYVAIWFAHRHPELVGKIVTLGTKFDWTVASAEKETRKLDPKKIEEKVPAFARILQHRHAPNDWKALLKSTAEMMTRLGSVPLLSPGVLGSVKNDVEILLGDQDDMADRNYSEKVSEIIPGGSFELLANTAHPIEKVNLALISSRF
jgi:pimeloyl-ACP methyl ester carboxylesterase